jgi:aspartyl-tRNA synthetase
MKRTHTCGELREKDKGAFVTLQGWVSTTRDHGGVMFIDMRDRYGITQTVFQPGKKELFKAAEELRREDCIEVHGEVTLRKEDMINPGLATGKIDVIASELIVLNKSKTPPIEIDDRKLASEDVRMKYRYLDLRRPQMQHALKVRHDAMLAARKCMNDMGFLEITTPMLVKSTPEGARDYIVPSRLHPGRFYALPQSPQLYKQLLMVAGCDKYFQFAVCCRDEDLRTDRQPEFMQIDAEMSFPELEDIYRVGENIMKACFKGGINYDVKTPFVRIPYKEAIEKYGHDSPEIRFDLFLSDITELVKESDFDVLKKIISSGGIVKCVNPEKDFSRKELDNYIEFCQQHGAKGMAWMKVTKDGLESNIAKYFNPELQKKIIKKVGAKPGSYLFIIADSYKMTHHVLWKLRLKLGDDLKLYNPKEFKFCWITDFPLFEWNEEEDKWDPAHHLFCMPMEDDLKYLETDPGKVFCTQYDLAMNGIELLSGSIRINRSDIQERVMKVIGLTQDDVKKKFGFLLDAFEYGAPPHGGFAFGFDRVIALMLGTNDIREVIAFPKNKNAESIMDGSPSDVSDRQLKELHIKKDFVKKK